MSPLFPDVDPEKVNAAGEYCMVILIVLYTLLFILCLLVLVHACIFIHQWHIVKLLKCLLPWPILARDLDFLTHLNTNYLTQSVQDQSVFEVALSSISGYLLFSVFLLLVLFWVYLFHLSSANTRHFVLLLLGTYTIINVVVYSIWVLLLLLMEFLPQYHSTIHGFEGIYAASLDLFVGIFFFVYGIKILVTLRHTEQVGFITKRVFMLTVFCSVLFGLRSIWIILNVFFFNSALVNLFGSLVNDIFGELLPVLFILVVLCWPTHRKVFSKPNRGSVYPSLNSQEKTSTP